MRAFVHLAAGMVGLWLASPALGQTPVAYPAKGQSPQQQDRDEGECHVWARKKTGIDPAQVAQAPAAPPPSQPGGERVRGAARGALGGAAIGAIAGDTGKGAGIGAVVGTMAGGHRARERAAAGEQQAQAQQQQTIETFHRAYRACMQGRGYTVN